MTGPVEGFVLTPGPGDRFTREAAESLVGQTFKVHDPLLGTKVTYTVTSATATEDGYMSIGCTPERRI